MRLKYKINLNRLLQNSLFFILAVLIFGAIYVGFILYKSREYAEIVNLAGKVRGDIQRFAKLYFAGKKDYCYKVAKEIDDYFLKFSLKVENLKFPLIKDDIDICPTNVRKCWLKLKGLVLSGNQNKELIFNISEKCWKEANQKTDFYQEIVQRDIKILEILYYFLIVIGSGVNLILLYSVVIKKSIQKLETKANFDALTGIYNRAALYDIYDLLSKKPYFYPLGLIIFDIDNFKRINDTYGHNIGDIVLKKVADIAKKTLRRGDIFARWGGEEFVVLLPRSDLEAARKVAEKLRKAIESLKIPEIGNQKVTASFGVTVIKPGERLEEAIFRADMALYRAKRKGKNRVEVHP